MAEGTLIRITEENTTVRNGKERVYRETRRFIELYGYSPSIRELCGLTGLKSTSTVHTHLVSLQREGKLEKSEATARTLHIVGPEVTKDERPGKQETPELLILIEK